MSFSFDPLAFDAPRVPPGQLIYAVGDIHGRLDLLKRLVALIVEDAAQHTDVSPELIFLGDYVDRGMDSRGVLEFLARGLPANIKQTFLRGNHEEKMMEFAAGDLWDTGNWLRYGGVATLASYGINPARPEFAKDFAAMQRAFLERFPVAHRDFLNRTVIDCTRGDYHFVHAGVRPGVALELQTARDKMWIREEFMSSKAFHGKMIVHGHTISTEPDMQPNRIGIDTGAYATGRLTCLALEGASRRFIIS